MKDELEKLKVAHGRELDKQKTSQEKMKGEFEKQKTSFENQRQKRENDNKVELDKQKALFEKQRQKLENDIKDINLKLSEARFEGEITNAKLKGEIEVKEAKINCQNHTIKIYETELNSIQKRFENKCSEISELEEKMKNLKDKCASEMIELEGTIKSMRAEAVKNDVIYISSKTSHDTELDEQKVNKIQERRKADPEKQKVNHEKTFQRQNENDKSTLIGRNFNTKTLLIGTSNIKYVSAKKIAGNNMYVTKVLKYTVGEAKEFVETYEGFKPDVVAFALTCNDIEDKSTENIVNDMSSLINITNKQFGEKPIVVSLPLPRKEQYLNDKQQQLSFELTGKLSKYKNVTFSNNNNLKYRGRPMDGILYDRKHLSRWGTDLLTENLKTDINIALVNKG